MTDNTNYKVDFYDRERLKQMPADEFKRDLKTVFDASIPWESPTYDASFQDHYFQHAAAAVVVRLDERPVALSLAFSEVDEDKAIFYISGIWVDEQFKSKGLGRLIIRTLIECGVQSCFGQLPHKIFIALRTQNPQIYEFFNRYYDVYPHWDKTPDDEIAGVARWVHRQYSPKKSYDSKLMIVRNVFPEGIVVGHLHPSRDPRISEFVYRDLDVRGGDSLVLVMPHKSSC